MTDSEIIELVKKAYKAVGRIPSRGAGNDSRCYAGGLQVLIQHDRLFETKVVADQSEDWRNGFDHGFEWVNGLARWNEMRRGIEQGIAVANAIFSWDEAPNIYHPVIVRETDRDEIISFLRNEVKELRQMMEAKK